MTNTICLDDKYSTMRLLTQDKPKIINNPDDKFETVLFLPMGENRKDEGGFRTKGYFKKSYESKPLISIITVVYNGEKYLEETIKSVINQTYDNVEYIIIDGGSTDQTLDIIKKYEDSIDYWVSEKDKGIYDAMNKGINVASGEWINFMNAGDFFNDNRSIKNSFHDKTFNNIVIIYGDVKVKYPNFERVQKAFKLEDMWRGMVFCHQSSFINKKYHIENPYNIKYLLSSDFNFFYTAFKRNKEFLYISQCIATISPDGIGDRKRLLILEENYNIITAFDKKLKYKVFLVFKFLEQTIKIKLKHILNGKVLVLKYRIKNWL